MKQSAIRHGARAGADIVGKLRAHQHHHRRVADRRQLGAAVAPGHPVARRQVVPPAASSSTMPLRRQLRADGVGAGEVARLARRQPLGDRRLDRGGVLAGAAEPGAGIGLQQAQHLARRAQPAGGVEIPRQRRVRQRVHRRDRQRRVQIVAQRLHHRRRHVHRGLMSGKRSSAR